MASDDPKILALQDKVSALFEEFDIANSFHEMWKPAAHDRDLHSRMGKSYASQGFLIVRVALRREMILALTRMWDTNPKAARMQSLPGALNEPGIMERIAQERVERFKLPGAMPAMLVELERMKAEVIPLIRKYMDGGTHKGVLDAAISLRHERLAHRQLAPANPMPETFDVDIEGFYADNARIIVILMHLVKATVYDTSETAKVRENYSMLFWAGARGEFTEGHPNFRKPTFP